MEGTPAPRLRDQRAQETRARLVQAATELVLAHGWRATTVAQIAERAGVAKGTFFVHFPTKEAVVLALMQLQIATAMRARDDAEAAGKTPVERLRVATMSLGAQVDRHLELSRAVLVASLESRDVGAGGGEVFGQLLAKMIADAKEARRLGLVAGVEPETLANQLMASYLGAALHCTSYPGAKPVPEVLGPLVDATLAQASARVPAPKRATKSRPRR